MKTIANAMRPAKIRNGMVKTRSGSMEARIASLHSARQVESEECRI